LEYQKQGSCNRIQTNQTYQSFQTYQTFQTCQTSPTRPISLTSPAIKNPSQHLLVGQQVTML